MRKRAFGTLAALLLLAAVLPACGGGDRLAAEWDGRTLCGIEYVYKNGMTWGEDFEIRLTEDRIVFVRRFSSLLRRYVERQDRALSAKRWNAAGEAVLAAMPELEPVPPAAETPEEEVFATDRPTGKTGLWLTWRGPDGEEETVWYYPGGERYEALTEVLIGIGK